VGSSPSDGTTPTSFGVRTWSAKRSVSAHRTPSRAITATRYSFDRITNVAMPTFFSRSIAAASSRYGFVESPAGAST